MIQSSRQNFPVYKYARVFVLFTGTVWQFTDLIEGAGAGAGALKDKGKSIVYITNNATRTEEEYMTKFEKSEINATFVSII